MMAPDGVSYLRGVALSLPPVGSSKGKILSFVTTGTVNAYIDDSGTHRPSSLALSAAWVGGLNQWSQFTEGWCDVMQREGPPYDIHAREFFRRKPSGDLSGRYRGWTADKAWRVLCELMEVIGPLKIHPFVYAILVSDFHSFPKEERWWLGGGKSNEPYYLPFRAAIFKASGYVKHGLKINVFHDDDEKRAKRAQALYLQIKYESEFERRDRLGAIAFDSRENLAPLQLSDLLTNVARRACTDRRLGRDRGLLFSAFDQKAGDLIKEIRIIGRDAMDALVARQREIGPMRLPTKKSTAGAGND